MHKIILIWLAVMVPFLGFLIHTEAQTYQIVWQGINAFAFPVFWYFIGRRK